MRILNTDDLLCHGNIQGRRDALDIVDAGMVASDPYYNMLKLVRLEGSRLVVGAPEFEAENDPQHGMDSYNVDAFEHIYVIAAGKGVWRAARALEDVLGEWLTGGIVISKHGDEADLRKLEIIYGNHPTPDAGCIAGSRKILKLAEKITERDLVFTIIGNGGSSLLTLPCEDVTLQDVADFTAYMQIERGIETKHLNVIRNLIDRLKGGKLARCFSKARLVNIALVDLAHVDDERPGDFYYFIEHNFWLHNMSMEGSFGDAVKIMDRYDAWKRCPESICRVLRAAKPENECVHYAEYSKFKQRMFGIMPTDDSFYYRAVDRARELGYNAYMLTENTNLEAAVFGSMVGCIGECIAKGKKTLELPAAFIFTGENRVTVGTGKGIGGRNQECVLGCAQRIRGNDRIVCAAVDTDGTDGPGGLMLAGAPGCLAGGIVDGYTMDELEAAGYCIDEILREHAASEPLWKTGNGINAVHGISLNDLIVLLVCK